MKRLRTSLITLLLPCCVLAACSRVEAITVRIPDADDTGHIARAFTCQGAATPLRFRISDVPKSVVSIALLFQDQDTTNGPFTHWVVFNAPATTAWLTADRLADGAEQGKNSINATAYVPPCPPSGLHHYVADVIGLDTDLTFDSPPTAEDLLAAAKGHIVARGSTTVVYSPSSGDLPQ
jgi:Raf kinase inhibitor-like YbhB/YbcL family protein